MDGMTLAIWISGGALLMFALGWIACWFWFANKSTVAQAEPEEVEYYE